MPRWHSLSRRPAAAQRVRRKSRLRAGSAEDTHALRASVEREVAQEWIWRLRRSSANPLEE
jgi:hypothetical protein